MAFTSTSANTKTVSATTTGAPFVKATLSLTKTGATPSLREFGVVAIRVYDVDPTDGLQTALTMTSSGINGIVTKQVSATASHTVTIKTKNAMGSTLPAATDDFTWNAGIPVVGTPTSVPNGNSYFLLFQIGNGDATSGLSDAFAKDADTILYVEVETQLNPSGTVKPVRKIYGKLTIDTLGDAVFAWL